MGWLLFFAAFVPQLAQSPPDPDCPALIADAFDSSGLEHTLRTLPPLIQREAKAEMQPWAASAINQALSSETLTEDFRMEFASTCRPPLLQAVIAAMNSPLALRMREMEDTAEGPASRRQLDAFVNELTRQQPSPARLASIRRLDSGRGTTALLDEEIRTVLRGFNGGSGDFALDKAATDQLHNIILVSALFAYRNADDRELEQYAQLWETTPVKQYTALFRRALLGVVTTQSREAAYRLKGPQTTRR